MSDELLQAQVGDELVVIDTRTDTAYALAPDVAAEYQAADGVTRRQIIARAGMVAAGVGIASIALPMAEAAASGITGNPAITLTPNVGSRGGTIQVNGSNFFAGTGRQIQTVTVDGITVTPSNTIITAGGVTAFTFVIPAGATLASVSVQVTDNHSNTASATLTVQAAPTITFPTNASKYMAGHNTGAHTIIVTGTGFVSGLTVTANGAFVVNSFTFTDSTHISVNLTGSGGNGATGNLTVTNPDLTSVTTTGSLVNG